MPSLTLRQIYVDNNLYCQIYQQLSMAGFGMGFMLSKSFELNDYLTYSASLKGNFKDYNLNHKLRINFNKNVSVDLKVVGAALT